MGMEEKVSSDYTEDGSVDIKGKPILRSKTGRWKACYFIVVYEVFERMAYYGIASNLVLYMTRELHEGTVNSSNDVTNWNGTVWLLPIFGAYIADAHLGRFWTFLISSAIYLLGMCLLTLVVSLKALRPPSCGEGMKELGECDKQASPFQKGIFYLALYTIALGTGGTKPNISTMGADQFDEFELNERLQKFSFFNWWVFSIFLGTLSSSTVLVYIQDNVGWSLGYGLSTIGLAISIFVFLIGTPFYRHKLPAGSPFTKILQVLVAALRNWKLTLPNDPKELHELDIEEYSKSKTFIINHTPSLRFLDKAAIKSGSSCSPWKQCPVTQVEETKQMIKMLPILVTSFIPSTMIPQTGTLFIKQGTTLDRKMTSNFEIPPACLLAFLNLFMLVSLLIYDRCIVPCLRKYTKNPRGITMLQRMGIALVLQVFVMITACLMERKRLSAAKQHSTLGKFDVVPLSIFILLPQFALMGVADAFDVSKLEFFYDQAPQGMKSLGTSYFTTSMGIGSFLSSFLLKTVADITKKDGHRGWILDNLNVSHLDYYYAFLGVLSFVNLLLYLVAAKLFVYNVDPQSKENQQNTMEVS